MTGETIAGRYALQRELRRTPAGPTYLAVHTDTGGKVEVLILEAIRELANPVEVVARFESVASGLIRLDHAYQQRLLDFGVDGDQVYLVSERYHSKTLAEVLAEHIYDPREAVQIALLVVSALSMAHSRGVYHWSLTPDRILLGNAGPKVAELGVAQLLLPGDSPPNVFKLLSDTRYLAPEQLRQAQAGPRVDMYALGAVLYHMVTGRPAYTEGMSGSLRTATAVPAFAKVNPHLEMLPAYVEQVVGRSLAERPADRFPDLAEFEQVLTRCERVLQPTKKTSTAPAVRRVKGPSGDGPADGDDDLTQTLRIVALAAAVAVGIMMVAVQWASNNTPPPPTEAERVALEARKGSSATVDAHIAIIGDVAPEAVRLHSTAGKGIWAVGGVPAGTYHVYADFGRRMRYQIDVTVTPGRTVKVNCVRQEQRCRIVTGE